VRHYGGVSNQQLGDPEITQDMIARRAFELWLTNGSAAPEENWSRAEEELREEARRQSGE
jgi:hypothetical protein